MPLFQYKAYDSNGQLIIGKIDTASRERALEELHGKGLVPFETAALETIGAKWWDLELTSAKGLKTSELAIITREWAALVTSDLPLTDVLNIAAAHASSARIRRINEKLLSNVREGMSFSEACASLGRSFPNYFISVLRAGEASGSMGPICLELANILERSTELRNRVRSALIYPMVLLLVAVAALSVIGLVLVPTLVPILQHSGTPLPFAMQAIVTSSYILANHWHWLLLSITVLAAGLVRLGQSDSLAHAIDRTKLELPIIGQLLRQAEVSRFSHTLGLLLRHGVNMTDALSIVQDISSNRAVTEAVRTALEMVKVGDSLSKSIRDSDVFPQAAIGLIASGEHAGKLDEILLQVSRIYESSLQRRLDRLTAILAPILTVLIGVAVGSLIMSIMGAILSVNEIAIQ